MDDQLGAAVGRNRLLGAVLVRFEGPAAVDVRGERRIGVVLAVARRHRASASSTTSIQWRTGVVVPLCRCWMQPMFAETIVAASSASRCAELAVAQARRELGLQHRVRPCRAAAQVRLVGGDANVEAERRQRRLDAAAQALAVLQRARRMEGQALPFRQRLAFRRQGCTPSRLPRRAGERQAVAEYRDETGEELGKVARQVGDATRLRRVRRIVRERVAVLLDGDAAARCVHHDRLDLAALDERPPGVDVALASARARRRGRSGAAGSRRSSRHRRRRSSGCRRHRARARSRC